jgi:hypothetical protein
MNQKSLAGGFRFYLNLAMVLVYALAGILLLSVWHIETRPKSNSIVIGCVLLLYAAYRAYKIYREKKSVADNHNSNVES